MTSTFSDSEISDLLDAALNGTDELDANLDENLKGLNKLQAASLIAMLEGKNVFLTGSAGTGKSYIVKRFFEIVQKGNKTIAITSTTGVSALLINGVTIHKWSGIHLGKDTLDKTVDKINMFFKPARRWKRTDILVIDEISMLSCEILELLSNVGKRIRGNDKPFGGLQVIFTGDFAQLPPVKSDKFSFESAAWAECNLTTIYLTEIIRQSDPAFQKCLTEIRMGVVSEESEALLRQCMNRKLAVNNIKPTRLFPKKAMVAWYNRGELKKLKKAGNESQKYDVGIHFEKNDRPYDKITKKLKTTLTDSMNSNSNYTENLEMAIGSQVMLVHNLDVKGGLANGSRGVITKLGDIPTVHFLNGITMEIGHHKWTYTTEENVTVIAIQIPLILADACTIHKTQGASLELLEMNLGSDIFEYSQSYVALSRAKTLEGLSITNFDINKVKIHPKVSAFYKALVDAQM
jgi:ATP-dependent DNA helicase PIF1